MDIMSQSSLASQESVLPPIVTFDLYVRETDLDGKEYIAGLPGFPRNFSRDTFVAGILSMDREVLMSQLRVSAKHMGRRSDPTTGEELGRVHHEYPGVQVNEFPLLTTYNACEASALFLLALEALAICDAELGQKYAMRYRQNVEAATDYILRHLREDIFYECPPVGADRYALLVTYWKDSVLPEQSEFQSPRYPIAYGLAHFQAARGIVSAARLLGDNVLAQRAERMYKAGISLFMKESGYMVYTEPEHDLVQASSDELHALAYIPLTYKPLLPLDALRRRTESLVTLLGIACTTKEAAAVISEGYHGRVVWPYEQAFVHYGASKFGLPDIAELALRVVPYVQKGIEYFQVEPDIQAAGNDRQLWSVAAEDYFLDPVSLRGRDWM